VSSIGESLAASWGDSGYLVGFGIAGVGMLIGLAIFILGQPSLDGHGEPADPERLRKYGPLVYGGSVLAIPVLFALLLYGTGITFLGQDILFWLLCVGLVFVLMNLLVGSMRSGDPVQRDRIIVLFILMVFNVVFWACFEQAGSSLTLFADRNVDRDVFGLFQLGASATQFFNPFFILVFGGIFSVMWVKLDARNLNPNIPMKFGLGIMQLGAGYLLLLVGVGLAGEDAMVPLFVLVFMYMLHTTGELFLSPIGLSMVTKLAPPTMTGAAMGAWFLSWAFSNKAAAALAMLTGAEVDAEGGEKVMTASESLAQYADVYGTMGWVSLGIGVFLVLASPLLNKLMHGIK
jgi:POT family proton-dependent oligopeptide transporter